MDVKRCDINSVNISYCWDLVKDSLSGYQGGLIESEAFGLLNHYNFKLKLLVETMSFQKLFLVNDGSTAVFVKDIAITSKPKPSLNPRHGHIHGSRIKLNSITESFNLDKGGMRQFAGIEWTDEVSYLDVKFTFCEFKDGVNAAISSCKQMQAGSLDSDLATGLEDPDVSDWTLICEGEKIPCSAFMLGSRSSVFKVMLGHSGFLEKAKRQTDITDIKCKTIKAMLKFIYTDELDASDVDVSDLFFAADKYNIPLLRQKCVEYLCNNINNDNAAEYYKLSVVHGVSSLTSKTARFISNRMNVVRLSEGWARLTQDPNAIKALEDLIGTLGSEY